ncbi:hypothetical protein CBS101457_006580 [Exobasidium rhododendri]|nr:hypothetical protein CBS101457_006580 [Exobasidium rhododendri]
MMLAPANSSSSRRKSVHILPSGDPQGKGQLGIGAFFEPQEKHCLMTWERIQIVVAQDDLDHLIRHSECEDRYIAWGKEIRAHYGGLESYVRQVRLGWKDEDEEMAAPPDGMNGSGIDDVNKDCEEADPRSYFSDVVSNDPHLTKTIPNDWPYAMPAECGHSVVWCKRPILDKVLFADKNTPFPKGPIREAIFAAINMDGIRGTSGNAKKIPAVGFKTRDYLRGCPEVMAWLKGNASSGSRAGGEDDAVSRLAERAHSWAGRFIDHYVKKNWPEDKWETAYFCNPPHLRTVPGLSHFHVIVREKALDVSH